jgi:transcriptional regulator with XRE-family HTH domain
VLIALEEHRRQIGARIAELREARGLSQEQLAHEAEVSVKTISRELLDHVGRQDR